MKIFAVLLVYFWVASAQPKLQPIETTGSCSPITTGDNNTFSITCGIGKQQGESLLRIVNKILADQLDPGVVMAKLEEILHAVNPNAPKTTYTFDGSKRLISPGRTAMLVGEAYAEFEQMGALAQEKNWSALLSLARVEMNKRPEWLTPYVFAGEAQLELGHRAEALELLETAEKGIAGNPDYDPLKKRLAQMLQDIRSH